jgi:hypothetical protein
MARRRFSYEGILILRAGGDEIVQPGGALAVAPMVNHRTGGG